MALSQKVVRWLQPACDGNRQVKGGALEAAPGAASREDSGALPLQGMTHLRSQILDQDLGSRPWWFLLGRGAAVVHALRKLFKLERGATQRV